jgi:nitroimidazol reductase NimA-like FMN-containing flavoprotein (pyridoxamine 5'-phosphate oxidase superfamily)
VQIEEVGRQASIELLSRLRLGRLACARDNQPYVTPFYYCYNDGYILSFSTVGQKIEWMRSNPRVCVQVDEIKGPQQWTCVIVFGRYEELPHSPEWHQMREMVHSLLEQYGNWWEPGFAQTIIGGAARPLVPVFFRIFIEQVTGHKASPGNDAAAAKISAPKSGGWWQRLRKGS